VADSNVTNSTNEHSISTFQGDLVLPVPLDPSLRAHSSTGLGVAMAGGVDFSLAKDVLLTINAEGYMLDQEGETNDDVSLLMAAGPTFAWSGGEASAQLVAFERWYGGISASAGFGLRGRYKEQLAPGQNIILSVDARVFESDYGEEFGGTQAGLYLAYNDVLNEITTGSIGIFVRRDWLDGEAYSAVSSAPMGGSAGILVPPSPVALPPELARSCSMLPWLSCHRSRGKTCGFTHPLPSPPESPSGGAYTPRSAIPTTGREARLAFSRRNGTGFGSPSGAITRPHLQMLKVCGNVG
jgi:hypothetical protein